MIGRENPSGRVNVNEKSDTIINKAINIIKIMISFSHIITLSFNN